jgi:hypothetical protein
VGRLHHIEVLFRSIQWSRSRTSINHGAFSPYFTIGICCAWINARSFPGDIDKYSDAGFNLSKRRESDLAAANSGGPGLVDTFGMS